MPSPRRSRTRTPRRLTLVVLAALLLAGLAPAVASTGDPTGPAAAPATARDATTGRVWGAVVGRDGDTPKVDVRVFDADWNYLRVVRAPRGAFALRLAPGRYHLQFVDRRPAYDVTKYAPTDRTVVVTAGGSRFVTVRMQRGGYLYGTALAGGEPAKYAVIKATNRYDQTYTTRANARGEFALGGLPRTSYYVFTYDRSATWVGPGISTGRIDPGEGKGIDPRLDTRAGRLIVGVDAGGRAVRGTYATVVSRRTGQFWTERAHRGLVSFSGLAPGRYVVEVGGSGDYFGTTVRPRVAVRSGRVAVTHVSLTDRGARVTGRVVDAGRPTAALGGVQVLLFDAAGQQLGVRITDADGTFAFGGQLDTQRGLTVVAQPDPGSGSDFLGTEPDRCRFTRLQTSAFAVTRGAVRSLGDLALPRSATQDRPSCLPVTTTPSPTPSPSPSTTATPTSGAAHSR